LFSTVNKPLLFFDQEPLNLMQSSAIRALHACYRCAYIVILMRSTE
jgi:hypothetical protein